MEGNYYKNKYRINSIRLQNWDYSYPGMYFITICTKNKIPWFGHVKNGIMGLNIIGCIIQNEWYKTEKIRKNVKLDEFITMPNHVHGIIEILNNNVETLRRNVSTGKNKFMSKISPKSNSLSSIVRSFKSACANNIHKIGYPQFQWQARFYEHIIRVDSESLEKIRHYIKYNPKMWYRDRNYLN